MQKPRLSSYTLTEDDAHAINNAYGQHGKRGSHYAAGEVVPLIVTKEHDDGNINGRLLLDGNHDHWVQGVTEVDDEAAEQEPANPGEPPQSDPTIPAPGGTPGQPAPDLQKPSRRR